MNTFKPQNGFTIVETLVSITILMIAIAGPLSIASKGLTAALASRDQMVASYLAQESMETIKNIRDNNLALGSSWLNAAPALSTCTAASPCDASAVDSPSYNGSAIILTGGAATGYPLRLNASNFYSHAAVGTPSLFTRYFYLTQINPNEYSVTVAVTWAEGSLPYSVTVNSELINNTR